MGCGAHLPAAPRPGRAAWPATLAAFAKTHHRHDERSPRRNRRSAPALPHGLQFGESLEEYEHAAQEQRERVEWAQSLAQRFSAPQKVRAKNEYEVWRTAFELLKSYFRQTASMLDDSAEIGRVWFKDFGTIDFEKFLSLRLGESVKRTWFFRVDFTSGVKSARYLFFFGYAHPQLRPSCDVTLFVAREDPPGSYYYRRLDGISAPNVPQMTEIGYLPAEERFVARERSGAKRDGRIEELGRHFFEEVIKLHFAS
jgi:hypothetical protein